MSQLLLGERVSIGALRVDDDIQARVGLDAVTVSEYATAMRSGVRFPPIVVFHDGKDRWLADGFHRVAAARSAGLDSLDVTMRTGGRREAVLFSVGANAAHGLRRSNADKRQSVLVLLDDSEWRHQSDRWIADKCGVSNRFVSNMRAEQPTVNGSQSTMRRGKDGRLIDTAAIGIDPWGVRHARAILSDIHHDLAEAETGERCAVLTSLSKSFAEMVPTWCTLTRQDVEKLVSRMDRELGLPPREAKMGART